MLRLRQKKNERGASLLEMAFALPLIILPLLFGAMDFSRAMYAYHFVSYAAREGSRWASVRGALCVAPMTNCSAALGGSGLVQTYINGFIPAGMYVTGCNGSNAGSLCATVTNTPVGLEADGVTSCNSGSNPADYPGCVVQVQVTYYYAFTMPFLSQIAPIRMTSTSAMTISQ
jgi:Flp pilus assembly protein TadG